MSEQFLAEAQIVILPDTAGFRTQLLKDLERAKKGVTVKVVVAPDMTGFRAALQAAVTRSSKGVTAKVLVRPDVTGFRAALQSAVSTAARGVTVPVTPVGGRATTGGGVAAGTVADTRVARAQLALATATDAGIAARRRFDAALSTSEKQMLRDQRIATQLKTSTEAVAAASKAGVPALLAEAEALHLVAIRENELNIARKARAAAPELRAAEQAREVAAAAAAEAEAVEAAAAKELAAEKKVATARAKFTTQATADSAARIAATEAEIKSILARQAADAAARKAELASARQARFRARQVATAAPFADEAFARNTAVEESAAAAERSEAQFTQARRASQRAARDSADIETRLAAVRAAERHATEGAIEAEIALNEATAAGIPTLEKRRAAELEVANARAAEAAAATAQVEAEASRAARLSQSGRALQAVGAQLAGLRGAALSANTAFLGTAAAVIALTKAVQSAAQFESEISVFRATSQATADEMERVRKVALDLGKDITLPGVGAQDAAEALTELSKAGLSVQDSIDGARGVLQLATAAGIDNAQATELAASALNAFGLAGNQAVRVADTLANAANASQGSIVDVGIALQQAAAVSRQAGLSLEQTVGVLTLFARSGLKGSDAGTSLRTALIRLINPTTKAQKEIDKLGLHLRTATGAINLGVFDEFTKKTQDLTKAERDQALAIIFGQDAIRGAAILAREGRQSLETQIDGLRRQGTAAELANARMTGFTGSLENLKNQLSAVGITIGEIFIPPLKLSVDIMADSLSAVNDLAEGFFTLRDAAADAAKSIGKGFDFKIGGVDVGKEGKSFGQKIVDNAGPVIRRGIINAIPVIGPAINDLEFVNTFLEPDPTNTREVAEQVNRILGSLKGADEVAQGISFTSAVGELTALQNKLASSDKEGQRLASDIADVISQLKDGNTLPPFAFPKVELPPDLKVGLPGKQAGTAITDAFDAALPGEKIYNISFNAFKNVEGGIKAGLSGLSLSIEQALDIAENALLEKLSEIDKQARQRLSKLQSSALQLEVEGATPQQLLANARKQEAAARSSLDAALSAKPGTVSKEELDKRRKAVIAAQDLVTQFEDDIKQNAEKVKTEAQDAANKADQAILDSFAPREALLTQRLSRAQGDEDVRNDRAVLIAQRKNLQNQIAIIQANFKDKKQAAKEIASRRDQIIQLTNEINDDAATIQQAGFDRRDQRLARQQDLAGQIGDFASQRRIIAKRIAGYNQLIKDFKGERSALQALKDARDGLIKDQKDLRQEQLQANIDLGQSIADLTGNKSPLLKAIDAAIADQRKQIAAAKKAGRGTVVLRTELNKLLKQRQDVIDDLTDANNGLTIAQFLTQNNELFQSIAGNIGTVGVDPFSGFDFSGSIVRTLTRLQAAAPGSAGGAGNVVPTLTPGVTRAINPQIERLIDALDRNTNAKDKNTTTVGSLGGLNARARAEVASRFPAGSMFWENRLARQQVEDNI